MRASQKRRSVDIFKNNSKYLLQHDIAPGIKTSTVKKASMTKTKLKKFVKQSELRTSLEASSGLKELCAYR